MEVHIAARAGGILEEEFKRFEHYYAPNEVEPPPTIAERLCKRLTGRCTKRSTKFWKTIAKEKYDLIYANTIMNGMFISGMRSSMPVITHVHELDYWIEKSGQINIEAVKAHSLRFIAASGAVRDCLVQKYGVLNDRVVVIPSFIPDAVLEDRFSVGRDIRCELGIGVEEFVVCASGWEFWRKGRDLVPQLLVELHRALAGRPVHVIWVGNLGSYEERARLRFDLSKLCVSARFHETGHVSNPMDYFHAGDVFALLSRDDPFPLVCLENAAIRKPIVCFAESGGMPEFVKGGPGIVVPYLDLGAMSKAIASLLNDESLRRRMGADGQAAVRMGYTTNVVGPRFLSVISDVLRGRSLGSQASRLEAAI